VNLVYFLAYHKIIGFCDCLVLIQFIWFLKNGIRFLIKAPFNLLERGFLIFNKVNCFYSNSIKISSCLTACPASTLIRLITPFFSDKILFSIFIDSITAKLSLPFTASPILPILKQFPLVQSHQPVCWRWCSISHITIVFQTSQLNRY